MTKREARPRWGMGVNTTAYSGWRWWAAVFRRWWWWYAFWAAFIAADLWWALR